MTPDDIPDDLSALEDMQVAEQYREGAQFAAANPCPYGCLVGVFRAGWTVTDPGRGGWQLQHERNCPARLEDEGDS